MTFRSPRRVPGRCLGDCPRVALAWDAAVLREEPCLEEPGEPGSAADVAAAMAAVKRGDFPEPGPADAGPLALREPWGVAQVPAAA